MSLIVAGGTGAVGRCVIFEALRRCEITSVVALTRQTDLSDPAALFGLRVFSQGEALFPLNDPLEDGEANGSVSDSTSPNDPLNGDPTGSVTPDMLRKLRPVSFQWESLCDFMDEHRRRARRQTDAPFLWSDDAFAAAETFYGDIFGGHTYSAMCLGTTRSEAKSAAAFRRCDLDYVVAFSAAVRVCSAGTMRCAAHVSSDLARRHTPLTYGRVKYKADAAVVEMGFPRLCLYRPGLLHRGERTRGWEKVASVILRGLPVGLLGRAIVREFVYCCGEQGMAPDGTPMRRECAGKPYRRGKMENSDVLLFGDQMIRREASVLK